jgi:hypothetical protein
MWVALPLPKAALSVVDFESVDCRSSRPRILKIKLTGGRIYARANHPLAELLVSLVVPAAVVVITQLFKKKKLI